ncbi:MAG: hypothetical protein ABH812_01295 [bacterium]
MKKQILIFLSLVCLLTVSGCSTNTQTNDSNKNVVPPQNQEKATNQNKMQRWQENFDEASSTEMLIGNKIMVMGNENSDGSVVADRIIIGGLPAQAGENMNSDNITRTRQQTGENSENTADDNNDASRFSGQSGTRPDFQNMSDEERTKIREQMQASRMARGSVQAGKAKTGDTSMARLNGEIIEKDAESITIKLDSGGSKLIFLSSSTAFMKAKVQKTGSKN